MCLKLFDPCLPGQHLPFLFSANLSVLIFISSEIPHLGVNLIKAMLIINFGLRLLVDAWD